jgi:wyosine [tRNA(Phe)-imidazoG37] synthetase (radical SAM superfamily)
MDAGRALCGPLHSLTTSVTAGPEGLPGLGPCLLIRNVPSGQCTYSCVYCCRGGTDNIGLRRRPFRAILDVEAEVRDRLAQCAAVAPRPRFLALLPGGEPTLDSHLGAEIRRLVGRRHQVVVWTNASLLWQPEVRAALLPADRVMVKVDAVDSATWRRVNRPARQLRLGRVLSGLEAFRAEYPGHIDTATTLVPGLNDSEASVRSIAAFLAKLEPERSYVEVRRGGKDEVARRAAWSGRPGTGDVRRVERQACDDGYLTPARPMLPRP